jgi:hypothetical protein
MLQELGQTVQQTPAVAVGALTMFLQVLAAQV